MAMDDRSHDHWKERLYALSDEYDRDNKFFENALKSGFIEGKMGARELVFSRNVPPVAPDANVPRS